MRRKNTVLRHAEEIAAEVWLKMGDTDLAGSEKLGPVPKVRIKHLDGGLNGLAWPDRIELNSDRLNDPGAEAFLQEEIRHELAHVAEVRLTGIMDHGPVWHKLRRSAGGHANRRDPFDDPYAGAYSGFIMFPAVMGSAVIFVLGSCMLHAPLWCAVLAAFAGFFFPPVCWAVFCSTEKSLHFAAIVFAAVETVLLLIFILCKF